MLDEDPQYLLVAPYRSHREIMDYPESRVVKAHCGHYAWLSPQGEPYFETCYVICLDCAEDVMMDSDPQSQKYAVPGSLEAIEARLGAVEAGHARAFMRQLGIRE